MNKYHARAVMVDNIRFDSAKEARRYEELKLLERIGEIAALQIHPRFPLDVNGKHVCFYVGDFEYYSKEKQAYVVEDTKGVKTAAYKIKKRLFEVLYNKQILET